MKKIAFILSLLIFSGGFTPAQAALTKCKDGTYSSSTGRGTCSSHGGVATSSKSDKVNKKIKAKLLKEHGVVITNKNNYDSIQFEAVRLNLIKQKNIAEAARIALIAKKKEALPDLARLLNAKAWGGTKEQAEMYNDFVNYLNFGDVGEVHHHHSWIPLSDAEIFKLQEKWRLTKQVQIYADIIIKASDKILNNAEIITLGENWGLETKEILERINQIGQPIIFSEGTE